MGSAVGIGLILLSQSGLMEGLAIASLVVLPAIGATIAYGASDRGAEEPKKSKDLVVLPTAAATDDGRGALFGIVGRF